MHALLGMQVMRWQVRRYETPEKARERRHLRFVLGLPPEIVYHHVREGVVTFAALCVVLVTIAAWQLRQFATIAPALLSGMLLATLTPTVLVMRRRYRHVVAGALVLAMLLGLFAAAINRYGHPATVAFVLSPTPSAVADALTPR